jgi:hypothetical protein
MSNEKNGKNSKKNKKKKLALRKETIRNLTSSELQGVIGGARVPVPTGSHDQNDPCIPE